MPRTTGALIVALAIVLGCGTRRPPPEHNAFAQRQSRPDCFIEWNPGCPGIWDNQMEERFVCRQRCWQTKCWTMRLGGDAGGVPSDCGDAGADALP